MRKTVLPQLTAEHNAHMAKLFPHLYRPTTPEREAIAARPIAGMLYAVDQPVGDRNSERTGVIESCTKYLNLGSGGSGRLRYVVSWADGSRGWAWESELEEISRPLSQADSEAKRNEQAGAAELLLAGATDSGLASSASDSPALVRVPEAVSDTQFPCFVDAADGSPTDQGHGIRVNDAEIDDGYRATKPIPLGGAKQVSYLVYDEKGVIAITSSPRKEGDTADDIRRADQKRLYAKREQTLKEWGYLPGIDTDQLKRNGEDPE